MSPDALLRLTADEIAAAPHEVLASLVQRYQDELDQVLEQAQSKEDNMARTQEDRSQLEKDLETAKKRVDELLHEQGRMEDELSGRMEVLDKLRASAETHESERQAWHDQEQHLKMRVADLTASPTKRHRSRNASVADTAVTRDTVVEHETSEAAETTSTAPPTVAATVSSSSASSTKSTEPAPPTATELSLISQLESLTTAHDSLASSYRTLQTEMTDLKRVFQDLQEENESYEILLGERTLSGEVRDSQLFRSSAAWITSVSGGPGTEPLLSTLEERDEEEGDARASANEGVDSDGDDSSDDGDDDLERVLLESRGIGSPVSGAVAADPPSATRRPRPARSPRPETNGAAHNGGLDLAAELKAAQQDDGLDEEEAERQREKEERRRRKRAERARLRKAEQDKAQRALEGKPPTHGSVEAELRQEVRALKDANKALTLYVSKIVDRVCQQEGFEKVLAVDYRQNATDGDEDKSSPPKPDKRPRPASISFFGRQAPLLSTPNGDPRQAALDPSTPVTASQSFATAPSSTPATGLASPSPASSRRPSGLLESVSSVFSFGRATSTSPSPAGNGGMKPLMLPAESAARKLEIAEDVEDEEDRRERARIHDEMVQLGFEPPPTSRLAAAAAGAGRRSASTSPLIGSPPTGSFAGSSSRSPSLMTPEEQEKHAFNELKEGRSSGFTEPPPRRMSILAQRRQSLRRSPGLSDGPTSMVGLGIDESAARTAELRPVDYFGNASQSPSPLPAVSPSEETPALRKAFRRLSAAFTSPPVGL
ncbi:hypothetical protein JCM10908_003766 [Rhodotorula pacifica]|uniref:uncharacterized protein n=1 Tax=Rhodotorula pacifica TaxID=1495444 RepID=UPI003181A394